MWYLNFKSVYGTAWLYTGLVVFGLGIISNLTAMANFVTTPPDQPAVKGMYHISHNPCHVTSFVAWLGVGIDTTSWVIIVADVVMNILMYVTTLAEECFYLEKYG